VPGIRATDKVLLWGGGVWNWFDPLTVIRAVGAIARHRDDVKLYFLGIQHPNPEIPAMAMANQAVALAEALGLKDRHVFFNHGWVPYDDRQRYLAEADLGVSAHFESVETRFSFRTRVLDYLWAGLPIVTTEGDSMAELIDRHDLGAVVPYGSVDGWIAAIEGLLSDATRAEATSRRVRAMAESFRWSKVTEPLVRYCAAPYRTPPAPERIQERFLPPDQGRVLNLVHKGVRAWKLGGPSFFLKKGQRYVLDRLKRVERANG